MNWLLNHIGQITWAIIGIVVLILIIITWRDSRATRRDNKPRSKAIEVKQESTASLSYEEIAARSAFLRSLKAVAERLATNASGSYTTSASCFITEIYSEVAGSEQAKKHPIIAQAYNSLKEMFMNLESKTWDFKYRVDKFTSTLSSGDIQQSCNETRNLVNEYRGSVNAFMKFLDGLRQEDIKPIWESAPYSVKIHKTLADEYDRLMMLVKDLRKDTPEQQRSLLPLEDALSNFPRASLFS